MKIKIFGKNIEVTEGIRSAVEEKIGKLDKYFAEETRVDVTLSVNKNEQKVEVTIPVKGRIIRAEEISDDMYVSIDMVEETIERQLVKYKNKIIDKKKSIKEAFTETYIEADYEDPFVEQLQNSVRRIKKSRKMGERYMMFEQYMQEYVQEHADEIREEARAEGLEQGIAQGIAWGREETVARLNKLNSCLLSANRLSDLQRALQDPEYRKQLLKEFGI